MNGRWLNRRGSCLLVLVVLALVLLPRLAPAATVKLAVDPNTEADWASDNLYRAPGACATPGAFAKVASSPKGAAVTFTDTVLVDGVYCYAATAVDTAGIESVQSNKVEVPVTANPPAAPLNLRSIGVVP